MICLFPWVSDLISWFIDHKEILVILGVMVFVIFYIFGKTLGWF